MAGISVVFFGLLVTSLLISAISRVPAWITRWRASAPPAAPGPAVNPVLAAITPAPSPEMAAVISALLEVEMRLFVGDRSSRFTFRPETAGADWRGDAARRSAQPIKGVR